VFYENAIAINKLSISVDKDEIVGVIGPNSAGKTTLMNTISGLMLDTKLKEDPGGAAYESAFSERSSFSVRISAIYGRTRG